MKVTRIADAKPYSAAKHFNMTAMRLQGFDASDDPLAPVAPGCGASRALASC